jgi:ABC-type transport system involved in Fe-S cluster assembly fused permease/ATPase subunit
MLIPLKGKFVEIVGLNGSGKLMPIELISRLYQINSGRIVIGRYDSGKTELYSCWQQTEDIAAHTDLLAPAKYCLFCDPSFEVD